MKNVNKETGESLVDEKVVRIGKELEGLKIVDVFSILGVIVVELVHDAIGHGYDLRRLISEWLKMLADNVSGINFDYVDEESGMLN
jgi:hypothetical protein